jgi:segregation and condensation protein B
MSHELGKRIVEALLFAADGPLEPATIQAHLPGGLHAGELLDELTLDYRARGVHVERRGNRYALRTAPDLAPYLQREQIQTRRLSRAALETLAIIAYHQPVTRAEIEEIRGVHTSKGTIDVLLETGWIRPRGRRRAPGKPITYGTTDAFLSHFQLDAVKDLPGLAELKGAGLLDSSLPPDFKVPEPTDVAALMPDELPLEEGEDEQEELDLDPEGEEGDTGDGDEDDGEVPSKA